MEKSTSTDGSPTSMLVYLNQDKKKKENKKIDQFFGIQRKSNLKGLRRQLPKIEGGIVAADEEIVGFHDLFDIMVDEVIKRINVLLHQSSHLHPKPIHHHQILSRTPRRKRTKRIQEQIEIARGFRTRKKAGRSWNLSTADLTGAASDLVDATALPKEK